MPRLPATERRAAIVDATVAVMMRRGMAATTVRDVADHMGTSSGLVHHYFTSMDSLLAAAFEQAAGRDLAVTRAAMAPCDGAVQRLRAFFASYVRADQDWAFQLWLDAWSEAARRPALRETSQRLNTQWHRLLVETVREGVDSGVMSCGDPSAASWRIVSLLDGLALQAVVHRGVLDRGAVIAWSAAHAEVELALAPGSLGFAGHDRSVEPVRS